MSYTLSPWDPDFTVLCEDHETVLRKILETLGGIIGATVTKNYDGSINFVIDTYHKFTEDELCTNDTSSVEIINGRLQRQATICDSYTEEQDLLSKCNINIKIYSREISSLFTIVFNCTNKANCLYKIRDIVKLAFGESVVKKT